MMIILFGVCFRLIFDKIVGGKRIHQHTYSKILTQLLCETRSEAISCVLKFPFRLISKKLCTSEAEQMQKKSLTK